MALTSSIAFVSTFAGATHHSLCGVCRQLFGATIPFPFQCFFWQSFEQ
jgi:hypothetical protein